MWRSHAKKGTRRLSARSGTMNRSRNPRYASSTLYLEATALVAGSEASVAMHGFFLYAVFFNGSLRPTRRPSLSLSLPFTVDLSFSLSPGANLCAPLPGDGRLFRPRVSSRSLSLSRFVLFHRPPCSFASLSSALLFPALVGKPSGPFAQRSPLARAAGRHIIFSVFLLRGNLSSGEPVERWRWQRPRR